MQIGMLWQLENNPKTSISEKLKTAVDYYKSKYKRDPTICRMNPSMFAKLNPKETPILELRPDRNISDGYFWIGIENDDSEI
jgi:hypothetical protein